MAGNATLDAFVHELPNISKDSVKFNDRLGQIIEFKFTKPVSNLSGKKVRVEQNLGSEVRTLTHHYEPGGGGYNSVVAMRNLETIGKLLTLSYLDVSNPDRLVVRPLRSQDITPRFFYERDIPVNLVIGQRRDKLILKGPTLGRVSPSAETVRDIEDLVHNADSMLINSLKDPAYFEEYVRICRGRIPLYAVVTSSLDSEFTYRRVIPNVRPILNYDESPSVLYTDTEFDEETRLELTREDMRRIRIDKINEYMPLFATLGRHGMYCATKSTIHHVKLIDEYAEKVNEASSKNTQGMRGAGDVAAGALVVYDTISKQKHDIPELLRLANSAAIKHIGYTGSLHKEAFEYIVHDLKPASIPVAFGQSRHQG